MKFFEMVPMRMN